MPVLAPLTSSGPRLGAFHQRMHGCNARFQRRRRSAATCPPSSLQRDPPALRGRLTARSCWQAWASHPQPWARPLRVGGSPRADGGAPTGGLSLSMADDRRKSGLPAAQWRVRACVFLGSHAEPSASSGGRDADTDASKARGAELEEEASGTSAPEPPRRALTSALSMKVPPAGEPAGAAAPLEPDLVLCSPTVVTALDTDHML